MLITKQFEKIYATSGRGLYNITEELLEVVDAAGIQQGVCHVFLQHTSASLIICENADKQVQNDLEAFMQRLVPDGDHLFKHIAEGVDDMPAHVRTVLTQSSLAIPIMHHRLALGIWQGVFIWEHRLKAHQRTWITSILGS